MISMWQAKHVYNDVTIYHGVETSREPFPVTVSGKNTGNYFSAKWVKMFCFSNYCPPQLGCSLAVRACRWKVVSHRACLRPSQSIRTTKIWSTMSATTSMAVEWPHAPATRALRLSLSQHKFIMCPPIGCMCKQRRAFWICRTLYVKHVHMFRYGTWEKMDSGGVHLPGRYIHVHCIM